MYMYMHVHMLPCRVADTLYIHVYTGDFRQSACFTQPNGLALSQSQVLRGTDAQTVNIHVCVHCQ